MNSCQRLWWEQAKSDHSVFVLLRSRGITHCHSLHYLQMVTEKIAKAYFWRSGSPPSHTHAGFVQFLRGLGQTQPADRPRIAKIFAFRRFVDFQNWIKSVLPVAYNLERLAPALANDGPNPEYPWPHQQPTAAPALHSFGIWKELNSSQGRALMQVVEIAVTRFPEYAGP